MRHAYADTNEANDAYLEKTLTLLMSQYACVLWVRARVGRWVGGA